MFIALVCALLFIAILLIGWLLTLFGLPGNWLAVATAAVFVLFGAPGVFPAISWGTVAIGVGLAALGEILEFAASAGGVAAGGSREGALLAIVGSFLGSLFGATVGIPIPLLGSAIGALLFGAVGAFVGAVAGELWKGRHWEPSLQIGRFAFWGRILGSVAKVTCGSLIVGVFIGVMVLSWL